MLWLLLAACNPPVDVDDGPIAPYDPLPLVDPFIGTGGTGAEIASVSPGASRPFGMVLVGPDTRSSEYGAPAFYHCAGYHHEDDEVVGFAHTHAHGMGVTDYGGILVMPRAGWDERYRTDEGRAAPFDHGEEWASPGRYEVVLKDDGTRVAIAATERGAVHRYTFADTAGPVVVFDLGHVLGNDTVGAAEIAVDGAEVRGFQNLRGQYSGRFGGLQTWFSATVDPAPVAFGTWADGAASTPDATATGTTAGAWVRLPAGTTEATLRVAISYVDPAGAAGNRAAEVDGRTYEEVLAEAEEAWREELSVVRVRGGTEEERAIFHTALYHASLMPSLFFDVDGRYRGLDGEVHTTDFDYYSDLSLWDTFRTLHPWYALARPDRQRDLARSLVRMREDGGWLPRWPLGHGYTSGMVGTPTDQVLAGTWLKGIDGWDVDAAWTGSWEKATQPAPHAGRDGLASYLEKGWVSIEAAGEGASKTLEYAWSDHALALWAESLGHTAEAEVLRQRAGSWKNLWDAEAGFFRGRHDDGTFEPWRSGQELVWTGDYTEGNAWHYLWYVPYDIGAMIEVQHGGDTQAFLARYRAYWDAVMAEQDDLLPDDRYWHGNEPVMHAAYLGTLAGDPESTAEAVRWVMANRYRAEPRGLDGNDDSGTLSAWYLFSAIGFFPIAGTPDYVVGSPLFERVEIDRPDGTVVIRSPGEGTAVPDPSLGHVFTHAELIDAGELILERP